MTNSKDSELSLEETQAKESYMQRQIAYYQGQYAIDGSIESRVNLEGDKVDSSESFRIESASDLESIESHLLRVLSEDLDVLKSEAPEEYESLIERAMEPLTPKQIEINQTLATLYDERKKAEKEADDAPLS